MGELIKSGAHSTTTHSEKNNVGSFGIVVRHAAIEVGDDEKDPKAVAAAPVTPKGIEEINTKLVPYLVRKATQDLTRTTVLLFHYNKRRDRTILTAKNAIVGTRRAIREAGLSRSVRIVDAGHAGILDTTAPLKARIEQGDSRGEAGINWILEDEQAQAAKGIEPPSSMYKRIAESERQTYLGTLFKQPAINIKNGRERHKGGARFSNPLLGGRKITILHVGVTHQGYHGAILKTVVSQAEALFVDFLEPVEVHPLERGIRRLYSFPNRGGAALIVNRSRKYR